MYKPNFNKREVIVFRQFQRKGYSLFACLGRVVVIGVLSAATLQSATAATDEVSTKTEKTDNTESVDKEATLEDVEVTGSRAPLALGQAARMVTVLSREEIQAAPVQSINDLLKMAVGVDVRQRGPIGAQTDVSIRGGSYEQIAVLLNGINICDAQTGHNAFDLPCDVADILRIEVLEGPAARVYGASSLVGAINIVTSQAPEASLERDYNGQVRLEGGSFGYLSAAGRYALTPHADQLTSSLSATYTRSDGYQRSAAGHLNSDYTGGKVFYQGGYADQAMQLQWHAGLSAKGFGSNTFYSGRFDEQYEQTLKFFTAIQGETSGRLHLKPAIYWNRGYDRFELIRGSEDLVPFNHHRTDAFGINLNCYFDWAAGRTAFGGEFRNEDIVSGNLGEPLNAPFRDYKYGLNRSNLSFHLEHNLLLKRFTLSAGFIAVKNTWNEMPFTIYPGIDASLRLGKGWKLYASYNASLRMPSFTELYYSVGGHKADKYLKPEELQAVEGGVKYSSSLLTAQASIYHNHCRQMIDWILDPTEAEPVWRSVNYTKVNTLGFETSATLQLHRLLPLPGATLQVAYSYIDEDKVGQHQIESQSTLEYLRHKLVGQLHMPIVERLSLDVKYRLQKRAGNYTTNAGIVIPYHTYDVVDTRLSWTAPSYTLYAEVNNLFGSHCVDFGNVRQPGLWLTIGAKYRFNI
ncbi:TonB-dependent receptor plug domain-containing protein [Xylanibacter brevis]|uniref:TonB-dependent receptor plug domain-containing protein n=1 Tax=Xylanibacter brevis TaxID=83231 RepID=UPI000481D07C|nr:TonB-dependent receptor [Xylanibacter brevis]